MKTIHNQVKDQLPSMLVALVYFTVLLLISLSLNLKDII